MEDNATTNFAHGACDFVYLDEHYNLHFPEGTKFGYDAPAEVKAFAHGHWFEFEPVHPFVQHVVAILYLILFGACTTGNLLVIAIFTKPKARKKPSSALVVTLACSDLTLIATQAPPIFMGALFSRYWAFGQQACEVYAFIGAITGCTSIWMVVFIGYDLHSHLSKRSEKFRGVTQNQAYLMIIFAIVFSVATNAPPFWGWGAFKPEGLLITCSIDYLTDTWSNKTFVFYLAVVDFFIPLIPVVYYYLRIAMEVISYYRRQHNVVQKLGLPKHVIERVTTLPVEEFKISRLCFTTAFTWFLAWTPYTLVVLVGQFGNRSLISPLVSSFPALFAKTASCFNPIIYAKCHPNFTKRYDDDHYAPEYEADSRMFDMHSPSTRKYSNPAEDA